MAVTVAACAARPPAPQISAARHAAREEFGCAFVKSTTGPGTRGGALEASGSPLRQSSERSDFAGLLGMLTQAHRQPAAENREAADFCALPRRFQPTRSPPLSAHPLHHRGSRAVRVFRVR